MDCRSAGVRQAVQAMAPLCAGALWSASLKTDVPQQWPLGRFLIWNVFGIICIIGFMQALWIHRPNRNVAIDRSE